MAREFKITLELTEVNGKSGVLIEGGGRIDHLDRIALVHALGAAFHLERVDWALLAATADIDAEMMEGYETCVPVFDDEE